MTDKEPTSKSVACVFSNKDGTFYRLFLDLVNDVNHHLDQVDKFIVCLQLVLNHLFAAISGKKTVNEAGRTL